MVLEMPGVSAAVIGIVTWSVPVDWPVAVPVEPVKLWHGPVVYGVIATPLVNWGWHTTVPWVSTGLTSNVRVLPALPDPEGGLMLIGVGAPCCPMGSVAVA